MLCLEHSNFFGVDDTYGPVAISLRRERMDEDMPPVTVGPGSTGTLQSKYLYRIIVRTCQVGEQYVPVQLCYAMYCTYVCVHAFVDRYVYINLLTCSQPLCMHMCTM